jgi:hypothetical protein
LFYISQYLVREEKNSQGNLFGGRAKIGPRQIPPLPYCPRIFFTLSRCRAGALACNNSRGWLFYIFTNSFPLRVITFGPPLRPPEQAAPLLPYNHAGIFGETFKVFKLFCLNVVLNRKG